ncbi:hypothetical protein MC28_D184 (plasmid) [Bacillus thuringiensis MC28]|nr:hypothetical protein MC28_D184 [Bacillus thuringiensis MC28]
MGMYGEAYYNQKGENFSIYNYISIVNENFKKGDIYEV